MSFQFYKCHKQLLKLKPWQWSSVSHRGGGSGREQCRETQWHGITVGIYVYYPHPEWGRPLLLGKPTSAGGSQQSMTVPAGCWRTVSPNHASMKTRSESHLLEDERTCKREKSKHMLTAPKEKWDKIIAAALINTFTKISFFHKFRKATVNILPFPFLMPVCLTPLSPSFPVSPSLVQLSLKKTPRVLSQDTSRLCLRYWP